MRSDEEDPLARAIAGNAAADYLVVLCLDRLRTLARRMRRRSPIPQHIEDTDDLLQNAAIRLRRAFSAIRVDSPQTAMALAITQLNRELVDVIRRYRQEIRHEAHSRDPASQPKTSVDEAAVYDEDLSGWAAFHSAVESLPQQQRNAVHFLWYLGLDQATAAKMLGIPDRTLRHHWRAARDALQTRLRDLDLDSG